jgi:methylisocitrate lyase
MLFPEAIVQLKDYERFSKEFPNTPILANITEFGKTPLFTRDELSSVGVSIILYPLSAHRAMAKAAMDVYQMIKKEGSQKNCLDKMQTRDELYDILNYHTFEDKLDALNKK